MANPIKSSEIFEDDGGIQKFIDNLQLLQREFIKSFDIITKKAAELEKQLRETGDATAENREEVRKSATQIDKLAKEQEKLQEAYSDTGKQLAALKILKQEQNRINKLEAKLANAVEGSYEALSAQYSLNRIQINKLSDAYLKNTKEGRKLVNETKQLREAMVASQEATGNHALKVGQYGEAIKNAIPGVGRFKEALNTLARTPILALFSALVVAIGALFNAFKRSEKGAEAFAKINGVVNGLLSFMVRIADQLAQGLIDLFTNPRQALADYAKAFKESLINRFEGLLKIVPALATSLQRLFKRDLAGAKSALQDAGRAAVQFATGLDNEQQDKFAEALKNTTDELIRQAEAFANLAAQQRAVNRQNRELSKELETINTELEISQSLADDTTKSFRQQQEALADAQAAAEKKAQVELNIARNNLRLINLELNLRRANGEAVEDLLDQQAAALGEIEGAQRSLTLATQSNVRKRREIARDEFERELDFAIDAFDAVKAQNERQLKNAQLTFEQRRQILEETKRLTEESFRDQIQLTEDFIGEKIGLDELAAESDQRVIRERLRSQDIDDITLGRILEIIRERKAALQDLVEAEQELFAAEQRNAQAAGDAITEELDRIVEAEIQAAEQIIQEAEALKSKSFFGILGEFFGVGDEKQKQFEESLKSGFAAAKQELQAFADLRVQLSERAVEARRKETEAAQEALNAELDRERQGLANKSDTARQELEIAKNAEAQAERERRRALRAQATAQAAQQAGNLITATSKIWAQLGFPAAIPATALLWGTFIASKVRAARLTARQFKDGVYERLTGGSHSSGNDIFLGYDAQGNERRAEGGESMAVFSRKAVGKYGSNLEYLVNQINSLALDPERLGRQTRLDGGNNIIVNTGSKEMAKDIRAIRRQGEGVRAEYDSKGRRIERYKNLTRVYVSN